VCGPSPGEQQLGQEQLGFYNTLMQENQSAFANNQEILGALNKSLTPILNAGINQQGFSGGELANLNSQAITGTGQNYAKAAQALGVQQGAAGGGTAYIPSGAKTQTQEELATSAAAETSGLESNIQAANYATGRQNYLAAAEGLGGVAAQYNPTGYANSTTGAGSAAGTTENEITQANNSWMQLVSAGLGAAGAAASGGAFGTPGGGSNVTPSGFNSSGGDPFGGFPS
jgi:hypothetical protein